MIMDQRKKRPRTADRSENARSGLFLVTGTSGALYLAEVVILGALEPGYSHMFVSELGMPAAAHSRWFSASVLRQAAALLVAAWLFYARVRKQTGRRAVAVTIGLFMACFGANYVFAAVFPLPGRRHGAFGIALLTFLAPWLLAWAFWNAPCARRARYWQLAATPVLIFLVFAVEFADERNLGLFQRLGAGSFYGWLVLNALWLEDGLHVLRYARRTAKARR